MNRVLFISFITFLTHQVFGQSCAKRIFGYVPTYTQGVGGIPYLTANEYQKLTHIAHLGPYVNQNGSLNMVSNGATAHRLLTGVQAAHSNGVPILMAFQAWYDSYIPALANPSSRAALINNVLELLDTYEYDGIDVDLEPIMSPWVMGIQTGNPDYVTFINTLYDSLQVRICPFTNKKPLLTVAANGFAGPVLFQLQDKFDMINIMTYDMAGVFPGWVTWHDAPVFDGGNRMPSTGQLMPSVHGDLSLCINAGVDPAKLAVGVIMDAYRWKGGDGTSTGGVTAPMQAYTVDPSWTRFSYRDFMLNHFDINNYEYDPVVKMSYLSKDFPGSVDDEFWSYNDQYACSDKVDYVWDNNLGGTMIWELNSGYLPNNPVGEKIPQLNFIYDQNCLRYSALGIDQLLDLECAVHPNKNVLTWSMNDIRDIEKFVVLASFDGQNWESIDSIDVGSSSLDFEYYDFKRVNKNTYYKIIVMETNAAYYYTPIVKAVRLLNNYINIYPNPVTNILHIDGIAIQEVNLYDEKGALIESHDGPKSIDMAAYIPGLFILKIITSDRVLTKKIIKY